MPKHNQTKQGGRKAPAAIEFFTDVEQPREENTLMGHPEACEIYSMNRNVRDPKLGTEAERMDYDYVSPARMNMRSKYGSKW